MENNTEEIKSVRKSSPSYIYMIIGMAAILFLFGLIGWFGLNLRKMGDYFKENIQVNAYISRDTKKPVIDSIVKYIDSLPYVKEVEYIDKEKAIARWNKDNDTSWKQILDSNPLPESIDFFVTADHVENDSLNLTAANLQERFPGAISEFQFPEEMVAKVSGFVKTIALILLGIAILLSALVIFSIDNTVRLAMYSNRFLIKTMQMVGATRDFIARPFIKRAIINGLIASIAAIVLLYIAILVMEEFIPDFKVLHDTAGMLLLFAVIIILGIVIAIASTYFSVLKYLKLKLDDLY